MLLIAIGLLTMHISIAGSFPAAPENITVTFLTPTSVRISWQTTIDVRQVPIEKFDVTYRPTDATYRVVVSVAANSEAVILTNLSPNTQYQLAVSAIWQGKKLRSRQIYFRTLEAPKSPSPGSDALVTGNGRHFNGVNPIHEPAQNGDNSYGPDSINDEFMIHENNSTIRELPTIRGVEVGIVVLVLIVWAGAIALFFNRWGKIRMLLPYQPDYKQEQLKVPGTGVCTSATCNGQHSHQILDVYNLKEDQHVHHWSEEEPSTAIADRCTRNRINSAIFVSSEGKGFDSIEFLRRYGSQSVLCRKARSAENITSSEQKRRLSENQDWNNSSEDKNNNQSLNETVEFAECYNNEPPVTSPPSFYMGSSNLDSSTTLNANAALALGSGIGSNEEASATGVEKTPKLNNLPTLSISGPSPPHDKAEFL